MPILLHALLTAISLYASITNPQSAYAASQPAITANGYDISYPQCGQDYPDNQAFAIIGLNRGNPTTTNPCLASQLEWANHPPIHPNLPALQLYLNTNNPGPSSPAWPTNNTDPLGNHPANPHGQCTGNDSLPCAWQFGWNRAADDILSRFLPAAQIAGISANPANYSWWLDVEIQNAWEGGSPEALQRNSAVLEGMVAHLKSLGLKVGLYSTSYQWSQIVGGLNSSSNLRGLPNWLPGARTLEEAQVKCAYPPFTPESHVVLTQYTAGYDYNYTCP